jgi:hypothetical protein
MQSEMRKPCNTVRNDTAHVLQLESEQARVTQLEMRKPGHVTQNVSAEKISNRSQQGHGSLHIRALESE